MKRILISLLLILVAAGCKKEENDNLVDLAGTSWESSSYPNGGTVIWHERLDFISDNKVIYYTTFTSDRLMTSAGKATLTFSVDNLSSASPKIHVTGKYNALSGSIGEGAIVDLTANYIRPRNKKEEATLVLSTGKIFTKMVYR
ncbi:MAG: hypothetical protein V4687_07415 [Bacteroidota bacterium]